METQKEDNDIKETSIHDRIEQIKETTTDKDRKSEIASKIAFGDSFVKIALLIAFWGFWIFWLIVALAGV